MSDSYRDGWHTDGEVVVFSYPLVPKFPTALSESEREIVVRLMNQESNAEIARARSTSVNTVGNQITSIFRKLGVNSRAELAWKLHNVCARCELKSCSACPMRDPVTLHGG